MTEISWLLVSALLGALLGAMASLAITFYYDVAIEPFLELLENDDPRVEGKRRLKPRHQFLEVKTRQRKGLCPFGTRRPAWRCRATIDVHRSDGSRAIKDRIIARWSGSLQPFQTSAHGQQVPDVALIPTGQHLDVHASREEKIGIALKYEGHDKCWIFSNESYLFDWENPAWELPKGRYYLRMILHYESTLDEDARIWWFMLRNDGASFEDWGTEAISGPPFTV